MRPVVLVVDDDAESRDLVAMALGTSEVDTRCIDCAEAALAEVERSRVDVVVTDVRMGAMDGLELAQRVGALDPDLPVVVMTGRASLGTAVQALRAGVYDYLQKPLEVDLLVATVLRALERRRLTDEVESLRSALEPYERAGELVGSSELMREVFRFIERVADAEVPVLIAGETGTGKELVARALHFGSRRRDHPFVAINCAAIPENLIESELFGHVAGAFTGASGDRRGLFLEASGGTLFLDEVGELPASLQAKLLRALQERTVRPVGGREEIGFDARVVSATNRDLEREVETGHFREDLYYRIDVVRIDVPPLRRRGHDILLLAQAFLDRFAARTGRDMGRIEAPMARRLLAYAWPGNVRELENCIERAAAMARADGIRTSDLPKRVRANRVDAPDLHGADPEQMATLEEMERRYIASVLRAVGDNKTRAANILGIDRRTLYRRLERHGLSS